MFTCAKIKDGSTYLSNHLSANDYYCESEQVIGMWVGKGAEQLGIEGQSIGKDDTAFEALRTNQLPDSSGRLTPRTAKDGVRFFDFQCSAQKSVSITAVTLGDHRLYDAHDRAARKAFIELERFAACRSGWSREPQITGSLCAAAFRHDASRALDPQLHTHFVIPNATWNPQRQRWLALDTCEMFRAIRYAGKVYQNELALKCRKLGYQIEASRENGQVKGFEIKGVPKQIQERFSKRREEIEEEIEVLRKDKGREPTSAEIAFITRETRNVKMKEISTPEVLVYQCSQLSAQEVCDLGAVKHRAFSWQSEISMGSDRDALAAARDHLFERHSVVPGHAVLAEGLNQRLGYLTLDGLHHNLLSEYSGIVQLKDHQHNQTLSAEFSSRSNLKAESWSVNFVNRTQGHCDPLGKVAGVDFAFRSDEQRKVVLETLANRDQVYAIRGRAGAGKTTSLQEIRKGLEAAGREVYYLAPTASAAQVLQKDGFPRATTVSDFLGNQVQTAKASNAVLVVDEAGLLSTKLGKEVLNAAEKNHCRLLLVGDTHQHSSVEAGDFLRILETHSKLHTSELKDIRRQLQQEYNVAIRTLASGQAAEGMQQLDALGWVHEGKSRYIDQAAQAYLDATEGGTQLDRCIAVCPTWQENRRFTVAIRQALRERGVLAEGRQLMVRDSLEWTVQQKATASSYQPGMVVTFNSRAGSIARGQSCVVDRVEADRLYFRGCDSSIDPARYAPKLTVSLSHEIELAIGDKILIRHNNRDSGLVNGQVLTVKQLHSDGTIDTEEGKTIAPSFRHFTHGYVVTSHRSQGRTHDQVVVAAEKLDAKAAYVACSRGRWQCSVHTPDKEFLMTALARSGDRPAALDRSQTSSSIETSPAPPARSNSLRTQFRGLIQYQRSQMSEWLRLVHAWQDLLLNHTREPEIRLGIRLPIHSGREMEL